jgi:hypothetical protein
MPSLWEARISILWILFCMFWRRFSMQSCIIGLTKAPGNFSLHSKPPKIYWRSTRCVLPTNKQYVETRSKCRGRGIMSHGERGITQQKEWVDVRKWKLEQKWEYKKLMEREIEHSMCLQHNRREGDFIDLRYDCWYFEFCYSCFYMFVQLKFVTCWF